MPRKRDSRSPPRRRSPRRRSPARRRSPSRDRRYSPPARRGSRYSPPPRRSRSRSRDGGRGKGKGKAPREPVIMKGSQRPSEGPAVTPERRAAAVECEGYLYAAADWTAPSSCEIWGQKDALKVPQGWDIAPADDNVIEKVIKCFPFGTTMLVCEGGKAYMTAKGTRPGGLEMIWDYKKDMGMYNLHQAGGLSDRHARLLIRTAVSNDTTGTSA
mmetsp:Transcript_64628/g.114961  ORF Transcript_64628/g.114961 Transcript_64628/m.114961 type:complete len:214 (+) Transcript_64628:54-695(+)